jgi:hypothetical protein
MGRFTKEISLKVRCMGKEYLHIPLMTDDLKTSVMKETSFLILEKVRGN